MNGPKAWLIVSPKGYGEQASLLFSPPPPALQEAGWAVTPLVAAPPEGAPTWQELADLLVEIDAAESAADNCAECERVRDVAEDSGFNCEDHCSRVRAARSTHGRYVALLSRIPKGG